MAKIQPAVSTILINVPAGGSGYVDLSQCASIVNRRFYRQGLNWAVAGFRCNQQGAISGGRFQIEKLPETWVMSNAWHKAFAMWKKQQDEAIAESGSESAVAKFRDFKILMDVPHVAARASNLLPIKSGGGTFLAGTTGALTAEWDYSQVVLPNVISDGSSDVDPAEYYLHMVGVNNNAGVSRGIIDGYASSRSYPHSPDPVEPGVEGADNWMNRMFNDGNANPEIVGNAVDNNDDLPYPQVAYPGGEEMAAVLQLHAHTDITATTTAVDNSFFMPGTQVPCGLLKFNNTTTTIMEVFIDLVPGHHRGYLCEPMQEF